MCGRACGMASKLYGIPVALLGSFKRYNSLAIELLDEE
jgi:hypothetical protein